MQDIIINHLTIDHAEALRYLRLPAHLGESDLPRDIADGLARAEQEVLQVAQPRFCWREFTITARDEAGIHLSGTTLILPGADIADLLAGADACVMMAATLGQAADDVIRRAEPIDMAHALMLDALASAAVENLCDQVQAALNEQYAATGHYLTSRFSPGYGDLPITLQRPLCATLDTQRRIGLTVSASGILLPRKSVTAIMGLGGTPPTAPHTCHGCATCNMRDRCPYRK